MGILDMAGIKDVILNKITLWLVDATCNDSRQILSLITYSMTSKVI